MTRRRHRYRQSASPVPVGLIVGFLADRWTGDPRRWHPVAGFGQLASAVERRCYADSRSSGVGYTAVLVGTPVLGGVLIRRRCAPAVEVAVTALATWAVLGGTSLTRVAAGVPGSIDRRDIGAARALIPSLCGRDPHSLDEAGICRATVESVAENTSDATVAPLLWGAIAGLPGLLGYRAINTLDAMVGYRSPRYRRFGWASARLDDAANLLPARLTATLVVALGGNPVRSVAAWRRDGRLHPSPNAGPVEASFAGALGVRLGGPTVYSHGVDDRPVLGVGHPPGPADVRAAVRLSSTVQAGAVVVAAGGRWLYGLARERRIRTAAHQRP